MSLSIRTVRSLIIAVVTLALAAGVAAAARPDQDRGLVRAGEAAGKVVPVPAEEPAAEEPTEETDGDDVADGGEAAADVVDAVHETKEHPENHGKYVSEAARGVTPDGWDNHGAYVRSIAQGEDGKPGAETAAAGAETAAAGADSAKTKPAKARGHGANR
ncbi:MAG: hypothetical protein AABZ33_09310 [Chloroflexota bacterium]